MCDKNIFIGVKEEDALLGYLSFSQVAGECYINNLAVHKAFRRRGIARALLCELMSLAVLSQYEFVSLEVRQSNSAAISLYSAFGFKEEGKRISDLYINVPKTTNFAIMFLATEGLYAEVLRRPGLCEELQTKHKIMVCGPTTITAFLNTLRMGFRTIAIDKRAADVWKVLGAAKTQYSNFEGILAKAKKKIEEAGNTLDEVTHRNSIIQKNLRSVESLDPNDADDILKISNSFFISFFGVPSSFTPKHLFFAYLGLFAISPTNSYVTTTAVKMLITIPIISVNANPFTEVEPISYSTTDAISVVICASSTVVNACRKP